MTRLLAALCMLSGILAVLRYEVTTPTGRTLAMVSVGVSFCGQLFVMQAVKPTPASWAPAVLALFWAGLAALVVLWLMALQ